MLLRMFDEDGAANSNLMDPVNMILARTMDPLVHLFV